MSVLLGNGDGTFQAPFDLSAGSRPLSVAIADFNGDGRQDLAIANLYSDTVSVLLGSAAQRDRGHARHHARQPGPTRPR